MIRPWNWLGLLALAVSTGRADGWTGPDLRDGDRVVFVGSTLVEREPSYGYVETALTAARPDITVTYRNLGWSGDTVTGIARARFGPAEEGFQHLKEHVLALKPTVLVIAYGDVESFDSEAGLPAFRSGLERLLDTLEPAKARVVLVSPTWHERRDPPLPAPDEHNRDLARYRDALAEAARQRGHDFLDLLAAGVGDGSRSNPPFQATEEGITLTALGYWMLARDLMRDPGAEVTAPRWLVTLGAPKDDTLSVGTRISDVSRTDRALRFTATDARLPDCPPPAGTPEGLIPHDRQLRVRGLAPGLYSLTVDGAETARATAEEWAGGVFLRHGPEREQVEALRRAIVKKNLLYFHRWRPQNETYLFGFRKHEQGQNAREVPLFDPLVAEQETVIARLKVPVPHTYELKPVAEAAR